MARPNNVLCKRRIWSYYILGTIVSQTRYFSNGGMRKEQGLIKAKLAGLMFRRVYGLEWKVWVYFLEF